MGAFSPREGFSTFFARRLAPNCCASVPTNAIKLSAVDLTPFENKSSTENQTLGIEATTSVININSRASSMCIRLIPGTTYVKIIDHRSHRSPLRVHRWPRPPLDDAGAKQSLTRQQERCPTGGVPNQDVVDTLKGLPLLCLFKNVSTRMFLRPHYARGVSPPPLYSCCCTTTPQQQQ